MFYLLRIVGRRVLPKHLVDWTEFFTCVLIHRWMRSPAKCTISFCWKIVRLKERKVAKFCHIYVLEWPKNKYFLLSNLHLYWPRCHKPKKFDLWYRIKNWTFLPKCTLVEKESCSSYDGWRYNPQLCRNKEASWSLLTSSFGKTMTAIVLSIWSEE